MNREHRYTVTAHRTIEEVFFYVAKSHDAIITFVLEGRTVLHSSFVLKYLLSKFPSKKFQIIGADKDLRRIAENLGIRCFGKNDNIEFEETFSKTHVLRHNFTFFEYFFYEIRRFFSRMLFLARKRREKTVFRGRGNFANSNAILLFVGLTLSISLLAFIFYFAVSKTYVTIRPDFVIKSVSQNFLFQETEGTSVLDTRPSISVRRMEKTATLEVPFNISAYDLASVRAAKGNVDVFNELPNEQVFRPNTRFVTSDGLVFRSSEWIKIPPMHTDASGAVVIGQTQTVLIADGYDTKGDMMGVRGNIPADTILEIPGLKFNRDKIYGKAKTEFQGGQNPTVHILTEEELAKFKAVFTDQLRTAAMDALKADLAKSNSESGRVFDILDIPENIHYTEPVIELANGAKVGDKISEVTLKGNVKVMTFTYDRTATLAALKNVLSEKLLFGTEKLHEVLSDSLKITAIISRNETPNFTMKGTTELSATISYNFEDPTNNLTKKLKNLIAGLSIEEARSILLNNNNIANVKITLSPFWLTHVSSSADNIEFIIEK